MRKLVRAEDLVLNGFFVLAGDSHDPDAARALLAASARLAHILQVGFVLLELGPEVRVVVTDRLEDGLERARLEDEFFAQVAEVGEFGADFVRQEAVVVLAIDEAQLFEFAEHLLHLDPLPDEGRVFRRRRRFGHEREDDRSLVGEARDRPNQLDKDRLGLEVEDVVLRDVVLGHQRGGQVLDRHLPP